MDVRAGEFMEERPLGHAIVKISDLCKWSEAEQLPYDDFQQIIGDSYQFVQAEFLFPIVSDWSTQHITPEKAQGIMFKRGATIGGHLIANDPSISMWSLMAGAHNVFERLFYEAVMEKKLRLLDGITRLPLEELPAESQARLVELGCVVQSAPAKGKAAQGTNPSGDDWRVQARAIAGELSNSDTARGYSMEKTWIDNEGRVRIEHDENFQMVMPFEVDSIWHLTDSWGIDLACRLILLGYNEDIKRSISYGFEHCPEGSTGRDRAHALITIADRFMTLAKSTIALGDTLKNPDTPANWIAWAKSKGYSVVHLKPAKTKAGAVPNTMRSISKGDVINAFNGLKFDRDQWNKYLGSPPNWLKDCRVAKGKQGDNKVSARWNPVLIAAALLNMGVTIKKLDAVFVDLHDWADEWREASANDRQPYRPTIPASYRTPARKPA